ncbi:unnamed protein product [Effrenium voratum]|nr:unnamed protein product [Effrenium voratum]
MFALWCFIAWVYPLAALRSEERKIKSTHNEGGLYTLCCVREKFPFSTKDREFQEEAQKVLEGVVYSGAYAAGGGETFTGRVVKHCLALGLEHCPQLYQEFFDIHSMPEMKTAILPQIESFERKAKFYTESYTVLKGQCSGDFVESTDDKRCSSKMGQFLEVLSLWKEALRIDLKLAKMDQSWRIMRGSTWKAEQANLKAERQDLVDRVLQLWA